MCQQQEETSSLPVQGQDCFTQFSSYVCNHFHFKYELLCVCNQWAEMTQPRVWFISTLTWSLMVSHCSHLFSLFLFHSFHSHSPNHVTSPLSLISIGSAFLSTSESVPWFDTPTCLLNLIHVFVSCLSSCLFFPHLSPPRLVNSSYRQFHLSFYSSFFSLFLGSK